MCAWKELENLKPKLDTLTKDFLFPEEENCESPFQSVITHPDPSRNLAVARLKSSNISKETSKLGVHFTIDKQ
jgi:hypothetical protein